MLRKLKLMLAGLMSVSMLLTATACGGETTENSSHYKSEDEVTLSTPEKVDGPDVDINGQSIYWLGTYDLNPSNNQDRSVALSLFEDVYGGKVEWVQCTSDDKFDVLTNRILGGDPVDMFAYEWDALPNGVYKDQYQPLDDYIDLEDEIWDDMRDVIDMYEYKGQHYVVPYSIADPLLITYSREMCQEAGLDDPYELYQDGEWDWDTFMEMMKTFVAAGDGSTQRYGIAGWFGQAMVQSTGQTIIKFDGEKFTNNVYDPRIEAAQQLMEEMKSLQLYDANWYGNFPEGGNILFYGMADWSLGASNAKNPDADIMVVPFPKDPEADDYYLCANFGAKMLVKNSDKGEAVGAYIYCERLAEYEEEYKQAAKEKALIVEQSASGMTLAYRTEEQYDAIMQFKEDTIPVFDFGYGMGSTMYGEGEYTYETRGIMNNLMDGVLKYDDVDSWAVLRDNWSAAIDGVLETYNGALAE